jgi:hypothetical protein
MRYTYKDIDARKTFQGAWALSIMTGYAYIEKQYFGYTKKQAMRLFHDEINAN